MRVCKYIKQRVRRIKEQNGKFQGCFKTKKKKHKETEFHNNSIQD